METKPVASHSPETKGATRSNGLNVGAGEASGEPFGREVKHRLSSPWYERLTENAESCIRGITKGSRRVTHGRPAHRAAQMANRGKLNDTVRTKQE
eukprot:4081473-Pleurochrysis_carterae.AAC.1